MEIEETKYTVWYRENEASQWIPEKNARNEIHHHSLNAAIKCGRYYQRMHGYETRREVVEA